MNNYQKVTENINSLLDFLEENTNESREYWKEFLEREVNYEDYHRGV